MPPALIEIAVTPEPITALRSNEIFVFGSNLAGRHGRGAAKTAFLKFGAKLGQGRGLAGRSFAIATKDERLAILPLPVIGAQIASFLRFAADHPNKRFLVTQIGCGLAGYRPEQIAPLFLQFELPGNVTLPGVFLRVREIEGASSGKA
jgi:hypothetical protein